MRINAARNLIVALLAIILIATGCASKPEEMPYQPGDEWTLVVIGDSSLWEFGEAYASQIEKDLGVKVTLEDFALPVLPAGIVRNALETGKSPNMGLSNLTDAVKEAEVVVMFSNPNESVDPAHPMDFDGCFQGQKPGEVDSLGFDPWKADLQAIWEKVIELRAGKPTVMFATDLYNPVLVYWNQNGVFAECDQWWLAMSDAPREAAAAYNIPFVSRYDAFNGTDHQTDLRELGYIRDDGEHPTELFAQAMAELFSKQGYYMVQPPK